MKCAVCEQEIDPKRAIYLDDADLAVNGIWFGQFTDWLWFKNEWLCSLACLFKFIQNWYQRKLDGH